MSFIGRFIHDFIQSCMPDYETRSKALEMRIRETEKYAEKIKTMYREPLVPWGYWKTRTALAKLYDRDANPHVQRMPGHSKGVDPWW